jgi:hypothetical protein
MADLYEVSDGDIAYGADINQYKTALEGGSEQQYAFAQKSGANFTIKMSTSNGSDKVSFVDSNDVEVASIDSDGNLSISGTFGNGNYPRVIARSTTAETTTSTSAVDLVTIDTDTTGNTLSIPVDRWSRVWFEYRKTATAAQKACFGLKINSTTVLEASDATGVPRTSSSNRAEAGWAYFTIPPRSTSNYGFGISADYNCFTTAGAFAASYSNDLAGGATSKPSMTAAIPNAEITSIALRAINTSSSVDAEIRNVTVEIW